MSAPNPLRADPTRTTMLRRQLMSQMGKRFRALRGAIRELVVTEDAFGLKRKNEAAFVTAPPTAARTMGAVFNTRWAADTDDRKLEAYREWLKQNVAAGVLEVEPGMEDTPWLAKHINSAYRKGVVRAYVDTRRAAIASDASSDFIEGGKEAFINQAFSSPVAEGRVRTLYTRAYSQLQGVTAQMDTEMSRILAQGLAAGHGPERIARDLTRSVSGLERGRAMTIARTEIVHAHTEGQLDTFEMMGVEEIGVMAEWLTAMDGHVCPLCQPLDGIVIKVKEARGMIPRHPNCRCTWLPANVGEHTDGTTRRRYAGDKQGLSAPGTAPTGRTVGQTYSRDEINSRIRQSLKEEGRNKSALVARRDSPWVGADLKLDKDRIKRPKAGSGARTPADVPKRGAPPKPPEKPRQGGKKPAPPKAPPPPKQTTGQRAAGKVGTLPTPPRATDGKAWKDGLTNDEFAGVAGWEGNFEIVHDYRAIESGGEMLHPYNEREMDHIVENYKNFRAGVDKAPLKQDVAYRGMVGVNPDDFKPGAVMEYGAHSSVAQTDDVALKYASFNVHPTTGDPLPPGTGRVLLELDGEFVDISEMGRRGDAAGEMLIKPGSKFEIISVEKRTVRVPNARGSVEGDFEITVVKARQVGHTPKPPAKGAAFVGRLPDGDDMARMGPDGLAVVKTKRIDGVLEMTEKVKTSEVVGLTDKWDAGNKAGTLERMKLNARELKITQDRVAVGTTNNILENFDEKKVNPIKVARVDGELVVVDGHHTLLAKYARGEDVDVLILDQPKTLSAAAKAGRTRVQGIEGTRFVRDAGIKIAFEEGRDKLSQETIVAILKARGIDYYDLADKFKKKIADFPEGVMQMQVLTQESTFQMIVMLEKGSASRKALSKNYELDTFRVLRFKAKREDARSIVAAYKPKKVKWTKVTSEAEFEKQATKKFPGLTVRSNRNKTGAFSIDQLNEAGEDMARMYRENPRLQTLFDNDPRTAEMTFEREVLHQGEVKKNWNGVYVHDRDKSTIHTTTGRSGIDGSSKANGKLVIGKDTWVTEEAGFNGTARHEFGHYVQYRYDIENYSDEMTLIIDATTGLRRNDWQTVLDKIGGGPDSDEWKAATSRYGSTNSREMFAEAFATWTHKDYGKTDQRLPKVVEEYMHKLTGKKIPPGLKKTK